MHNTVHEEARSGSELSIGGSMPHEATSGHLPMRRCLREG